MREPLHFMMSMSVASMMTVISITFRFHFLDHFIWKKTWMINYSIIDLNLLIKMALTIPSATAGNIGAMVIMAGNVVVTPEVPVVTPVVTPPVVPVVPVVPVTTWRRRGMAPSMEVRSGSGGRGVH